MKRTRFIHSIPFKLTALAVLCGSNSVLAFQVNTSNSDIRVQFDNTVKYSSAYRLKDPSELLTSSPNQDDGNNNFDKGFVSNRFDLFSELDASYKEMGLRVSGAAWYDFIYNQDTDNKSFTSNHQPASEFSDYTREIMGRKAELMDAFVYARIPVHNDMTATIRAGRYALIWGESLFYGANGIAGGQAPMDVVKLQSVPNSQFKEVVRPTGKISFSLPLTETLSFGAYWGFEWEESRLQPAGAYLSTGDTLGGERVLAGPGVQFDRIGDIEGSDSGQYGAQLRWTSYDLDADFGLYAIRYNANTPSNIYFKLDQTFTPSEYQWVYHDGIEAYAASMAKSIGIWSLAGEISYRTNTPLASSSASVTPMSPNYDNDKTPGYALGETAHINFNWLASLGPSFISDEASFLGEVAWNRRLIVDENKQMLNPNSDRDATSFRLVYSPTYRQLFSGLDVSPVVGYHHTWGNSSAIGPSFGIDGGGDVNVGVNALYLNQWKFSLSYISYLGDEGNYLDDNRDPQYKQALKDRDFIAMSVSTTF
ncbi:DUF1302 domain-containing protein [Vibrio sp. FJH11]